MGTLVLNEFECEFLDSPCGLYAKMTPESRLVEQRMELFVGRMQARPFTARTNLVHITVDCDVWIELVPNAGADMDMEAGTERWVRVAPGAQLTATEAFNFSSREAEEYE